MYNAYVQVSVLQYHKNQQWTYLIFQTLLFELTFVINYAN